MKRLQGHAHCAWSTLLSLRPKTVLISFGTVTLASEMPQAYKETIRSLARAFPDVTFIWKYEVPSDRVSEGVGNIIETTWAPQRDMLCELLSEHLTEIMEVL